MATLQELQQKISAGGVPDAALMDQYRAALGAQTAAARQPQTNPLIPAPAQGMFAGNTPAAKTGTLSGGIFGQSGNITPRDPNAPLPPWADDFVSRSPRSNVPFGEIMNNLASVNIPGLGGNGASTNAPVGALASAAAQPPQAQNPLLPAPAYAGQNLQQMRDFRASLEAKGVDVNSPDFYKNPEWVQYIQDDMTKLQPVFDAQKRQYDEQGYVGPVGWKTTPTDVLTKQLEANPALREGWREYLPAGAQATVNPLIGHNNPPPGPLPSTIPTPDTAPLTTRPPTRFAAEYPYPSPTNRQLAAANDQRATPMTQPVGFASNNPLLNRFGSARLGEYTGARETPGNAPPAWTPTTNPLPGIINGQQGSAAVAASGQQPPAAPGTIAGVPAAAAVPLAGAALGLVGLSGDALIRGAAALPGGIELMSGLGITASNTAGYEMGANGRLVRSASGLPTPVSTSFAENFNAAMKPGWLNVASAGIAALPDILNGDYTRGIGAGLGNYAGMAAGTALGAGVGGTLGNFIIPGLGAIVGTYIGRKAGGLFGPGKSVGPNAGQSMEFDRTTGQLMPGQSGQDNKGGDQEGFVNKFMGGVATVVNEANAKTGGKYIANVSKGLPLYVEVLGGKINVYDDSGNVKTFAGNQTEDAFKYAVDVATRYPGLKLPG